MDLIPALSLNWVIFIAFYLMNKCILKRKKITMSKTIGCMMYVSFIIFFLKAIYWLFLLLVFETNVF